MNLRWWLTADAAPRKRALFAAALGWMLDSFDINLYALVLPSLMRSLSLDQTTAGSLQSMMLLAAAVGGLAFGVLADRWGRTRALMLSVLLYSIFTAACGSGADAVQLAVFRILSRPRHGRRVGERRGARLRDVARRHRGKALGFMQSAWAIGFVLAAIVNWLVQAVFGLDWRAVFFVGVLPALFTLWVRRRVEEPADVAPHARHDDSRVSLRQAPSAARCSA